MENLSTNKPVLTICYELQRELPCDFVGIAIQNENGPDVQWHLAVGNENDKYKRITVRYGKGIAGRVISTGRPIEVADFPHGILGKVLEHPIMLAEKLISAYAVPIHYRNIPKGVLLVGRRREKAFSDQEKLTVRQSAGLLEKLKVRQEIDEPINELVDLRYALDESTILAFTDQKGIIKYVNEQFCKVSKYSREELIGQDHRIVNSGFHLKDFFSDMWKTILSGQVWKGEIKNRAKDGTTYWVDTTIVPFLDGEGKPYQYLAIRYDITKLKSTEEELQKMTNRIIDVQEEERRSLSRNLHDGVGQNLYSHLITINRLQAEIDHPLLNQMAEEATQLMEEVREISWELRPSVLDDLGLVPAIRSFLVRYSTHYGIDVTFDCVLNRRLDANKEIAVYRIIQEALTNTRKYAEPTYVAVTIRELETVVRVMIEDKGKGFNPAGVIRGVGLFSMDERARAVGGTLQILAEIGRGTKVILEVPV